MTDDSNSHPKSGSPKDKGGGTPKSQRKVAKTILEGDVPALDPGESLTKSVAESPKKNAVARTILEVNVPQFGSAESLNASAPKKRISKVSQTFLEAFPIRNLEDQRKATEPAADPATEPAAEPAADPARSGKPPVPQRLKRDYVAKTMLDHGVLFDVLTLSKQKFEAKAIEIIKEKSKEPQRQFHPVEADKLASTCPWSWKENKDGIETKERVLYCELCQKQVYNFDGMERPQAEALVFKRETIKEPTLYKRSDGMFMTSNCPAQGQKQKQLFLLVAGALVLVAFAVALLLMLPPPPKPSLAPVPSQRTTDTGRTSHPESGSGSPALNNSPGNPSGYAASGGSHRGGEIHFHKGETTTPQAAPVPSPATPQSQYPSSTTTTTDPDEDGSMWQYSGHSAP